MYAKIFYKTIATVLWLLQTSIYILYCFIFKKFSTTFSPSPIKHRLHKYGDILFNYSYQDILNPERLEELTQKELNNKTMTQGGRDKILTISRKLRDRVESLRGDFWKQSVYWHLTWNFVSNPDANGINILQNFALKSSFPHKIFIDLSNLKERYSSPVSNEEKFATIKSCINSLDEIVRSPLGLGFSGNLSFSSDMKRCTYTSTEPVNHLPSPTRRRPHRQAKNNFLFKMPFRN